MVQLEPRARREQWIDGNLPTSAAAGSGDSGRALLHGQQRSAGAHAKSVRSSLTQERAWEQVRAMYDDTGCTRAHSEVGASSA